MAYCVKNNGTFPKVVCNITIAPGQVSRPLTEDEVRQVWSETHEDLSVLPFAMEDTRPMLKEQVQVAPAAIVDVVAAEEAQAESTDEKTVAGAKRRGRTKSVED